MGQIHRANPFIRLNGQTFSFEPGPFKIRPSKLESRNPDQKPTCVTPSSRLTRNVASPWKHRRVALRKSSPCLTSTRRAVSSTRVSRTVARLASSLTSTQDYRVARSPEWSCRRTACSLRI
ncbi:hypothetical protein PIB30_074935 [Stylosanthes scabra]|uniref:Uncharacterized protein n=1 Tax=Stylosanthes scabra TaxID=79078 RepID=A0ABU6SQS6_9FABA|nr:hypothetical protein [Stylosanthes scabra]